MEILNTKTQEQKGERDYTMAKLMLLAQNSIF